MGAKPAENFFILDEKKEIIHFIKDHIHCSKTEDAFYVCDIGDIIEKHEIIRKTIPRVTPYYAVKTNNNPMMLKTLVALGTGFDCASKAELLQILSLGVDPEKIIFANPTKFRHHIKYAKSVGVKKLTFDNEEELYKIKQTYPESDLVIRVRCDSKIAAFKLGDKFGCDHMAEGPKLLRLVKSLDLNAIGVSFHVGSGCKEPEAYRRGIEAARMLFDYGKQIGIRMSFLDIGGGLLGAKGLSLDPYAKVINKALEDFFPESDVEIISEPGTYYSCSAFTLALSVHSKKKVLDKKENIKKIMYYVNDGVFGSFMARLFPGATYSPILLKDYSGPNFQSQIWGPTCDGEDEILNSVLLPELYIGDWMAFENMGSYTITLATSFNGFRPSETVYVISKDGWKLLSSSQLFKTI